MNNYMLMYKKLHFIASRWRIMQSGKPLNDWMSTNYTWMTDLLLHGRRRIFKDQKSHIFINIPLFSSLILPRRYEIRMWSLPWRDKQQADVYVRIWLALRLSQRQMNAIGMFHREMLPKPETQRFAGSWLTECSASCWYLVWSSPFNRTQHRICSGSSSGLFPWIVKPTSKVHSFSLLINDSNPFLEM